jgi:hypothetical protein
MFPVTFDAIKPETRLLSRNEENPYTKSSAAEIHRTKAHQKLKDRFTPDEQPDGAQLQSAFSFFTGPFDAFSFTEGTLKDIDVMGPRRPLWLLDIEERNTATFYTALRVCLQFHFAFRNVEKVWVGPLQIILRGHVSAVALAILDEFDMAPDEIHFSARPESYQELIDFVTERPSVLRNVTIFKCDGVQDNQAAQDLKLFVSKLTTHHVDLVERQHFIVAGHAKSSYKWSMPTHMSSGGQRVYKLGWRHR